MKKIARLALAASFGFAALSLTVGQSNIVGVSSAFASKDHGRERGDKGGRAHVQNDSSKDHGKKDKGGKERNGN
jgi:hypothetical protein